MDKLWGALKSKTIWVAVIAAALPFIAPPVQDWIAANPGFYSAALGMAMMALRAFTTQSLAEKGNPPGQPPSA